MSDTEKSLSNRPVNHSDHEFSNDKFSNSRFLDHEQMSHKQLADGITDDDFLDDELLEEVATWLVTLSGDDCTDEQRVAFQKWQAQSAKHQMCVQSMQATLQQFEQIQHSPSAPISNHLIEQAITDGNHKYQFHHLFIVVLISGLMLGLIAWQFLPTQQWLADTRNHHDQWTTQTLTDHSEIKISGSTAYDIDFDQQQRLIKLYNGNILVDVAKDASCPFVIQTDYARITALGTRFIVQQQKHATILIMLESKTRVDKRAVHQQNAQQHTIEVSAGQQISINDLGIGEIQLISGGLIEDAWKHHLFVAQQMPVEQGLDQLQSYQENKLIYDAATLHHITVNATLPLNSSALVLLEQSLPIQIEPTLFGDLRIKEKNKDK